MEKTQRKVARANLTRVIKEINDVSATVDIETLECVRERLAVAKAALVTANGRYEAFITAESAEAEWTTIFEYDNNACDATTRIQRRIDERRSIPHINPPPSTGGASRSVTHLKKLEIPKFDGDIGNWLPFWVLFKPSVHENEELTDSERFGFLMQNVVGRARQALQGFTPTSECYRDAVDLLIGEYAEESKIIDYYFQKMSNIRRVKSEDDLNGLRTMHAEFVAVARSLKGLGVEAAQYVLAMKDVLLRALPEQFRLQILRDKRKPDRITSRGSSSGSSSTSSGHAEADVLQILEFVKVEVDALEQNDRLTGTLKISKPMYRSKTHGEAHNSARPVTTTGLVVPAKEACLFCNRTTHHLADCQDNNISHEAKIEILQGNRRCFRCTRPGHSARDCRVSRGLKCKLCSHRHATAVCNPNRVWKSTTEEESSVAEATSANLLTTSTHRLFLKTASARVACATSPAGSLVRMIIDDGSQMTYIKGSIVRALRLPIIGAITLRINHFGASEAKPQVCNKIRFQLVNRFTEEAIEVTAVEVPNICIDNIPTVNSDSPLLKNFDFDLADVESLSELDFPGISLLIDADNYWSIVTGRVDKLTEGLRAVETKLGWTIHGCEDLSTPAEHSTLTLLTQSDDVDISNLWKLDSLGIKDDVSEQGDYVETYMNNMVSFVNGRYEAKLPWLSKELPLQSNVAVAKCRLGSLLRKLRSDGKFEEYDDIIQNYVTDGIAEVVRHPKQNSGYYMPHRAVYRQEAATTKTRIVFDASSHLPGQRSLNDCLHSGFGSVSGDLVSILFKFRSYQIALTADMQKAFLQILLAPEDQEFHKFLWVDKSAEMTTYKMKRVTFGIRSSPFMLAATLRKHLLSCNSDTAKLLLESIYVDDVVFGAQDVPTAKKLYQETTSILHSVRMALHKWQSNSETMRQHFGGTIEDRKILGLSWNSTTDTIRVDLSSILNYIAAGVISTKRTLLQAVARIYDPLGLLNPFVITMKILIQDVWKEGPGWDEIIGDELLNRWLRWSEQIRDLEYYLVPRRCFPTDLQTLKVHVFCDASPRAYGVVIYLTTEGSCELFASRARVAPLKSNELSLPKLELTAALLGAQLFDLVRSALPTDVPTYFWSDSRITLHWLATEPTKWKPYVAARVRKIRAITMRHPWRHCPGKENPADLTTRGITARQLQESRWLRGPPWLCNPELWPGQEETDESLQILAGAFLVESHPANTDWIEVHRFSSITKLLMTAYTVLLFIGNSRKQKLVYTGGIHRETYESAEYAVLRQIQANHKATNPKAYAQLNLYEDAHRIWRLRGRLQFADLGEFDREPILLPKESHFTTLLIQDTHKLLKHAGVSSVVTKLRQRYWIMQARQKVKSVISRCVVCQRMRQKEISVTPGPLPRERLITTRAFENTGVDFAGPLFIRTQVISKVEKVYIVLFTCANVRAVHLELVQDMSANTFILALRRFFARRGLPKCILSDNAKTFKRSASDITKLFSSSAVRDEMVKSKVEWKFIVPLAPWWGGFWERMVRSVKTALRSSLDRRLLTLDELVTTLTETETVINQRPLTYVSNDVNDLLPLRPIDYLQGSRFASFDPSLPTQSKDLSTAWTAQTKIMRAFWRRWQSEYLMELRATHLYTAQGSPESSPLREGDVVLLKEPNIKRHEWRLVRVNKTFPGRDGKIRSCEIRWGDGKIAKRPVQLLIPLEVLRTPAAEDVGN